MGLLSGLFGGGSKTQTTTKEPWKPTQGYLEQLLSQAADLANGNTAYEKEYVGLTDEQRDALNKWQSFYAPGGQFESIYGSANSALQGMLKAPDNVYTDPTVQGLISSGTQNIQTQLSEEFLPQIRSGATGAGQFGSTRQGVAEGVAQGKASSAAADLATNIYADAAKRASQESQFATQMLPLLEQMGTSGARTQFDIAEILRKDQAGELENDWWNQTQAPWAGLEKWAGLLYPAAGMGGTTSTTVPGASPFEQIVGLGTTALGGYGALKNLGWFGG